MRYSRQPSRRHGFTLIELAIVIAVLSLIVGGILGAQSMIKSAEINKVVQTVKQYETTISAFYEKYGALPGDIANATSFFGTISGGGGCSTGGATGAGTGTCNGDGNGLVETYSGGCASPGKCENWYVFEHLFMANLVEIRYRASGTIGLGALPSQNTYNSPTNVIRDRVIGLFVYGGLATTSGQNPMFDSILGRSGNAIMLLRMSNSSLGSANGFTTAEEMWNIDTKMDDGRAITGRLVAGSSRNNVTSCTTSGTQLPFIPVAGEDYDLSGGTHSTSCTLAYFYDEDR